MSDYESDPESCIFCTISSGQDPNASILHSDDDVVCFWDIYPAAPQHYLVVPKKHIVNCAALDKHDVSLDQRADQRLLFCSRLGFHLPKFTSVGHLHLHVLAPARMC
ncbi:histidine triad nucleotide-binding protein 3-like [Chanos chanos]|uniref:Adenosine 5'-monophosphoramidase HINT3 n=1 Tax=Chanos chanos TaxID=29144 RepID=A0A6J2V8D7_CHACN|nr:histidine triad nucleotide-binding protein 3-like [Chanos chanos]